MEKYYGKLWNEQCSKGEEGTVEERSEGTDDNEDMITIEELNEVLKHAKQEKMWIRQLTDGIVEIWRNRIKNTLTGAV